MHVKEQNIEFDQLEAVRGPKKRNYHWMRDPGGEISRVKAQGGDERNHSNTSSLVWTGRLSFETTKVKCDKLTREELQCSKALV